ncbi:stereocilin-like isoform X2 [Boleophthalmus pectinirostris]|uniref:stereocilin-like isoform X2 n=1 Tax=Boleophthalmus pectinirostris TaxID=150288 RepID=UPI002432C9D6|nr:stereocilin-like isoform X2 [Boleophthalmus pectinirostris]
MYTGVYTEEEFLSLGIMATFVTDEIFIQLDRNFFMENMDFLQTFCYGTTKMDIVARILQETATFGPVKTWTKATLSQVGRFLFFLPINKLQEIPQELMSVARIERLFMVQREWEGGPVGSHCLDASERKSNFEKQQFVLQFFLGFLKVLSTPQIVPTCEILHSTTPSVWISASLTSMSSSAFLNCLELMGQDPFLPSYHRIQVLQKVKKMYGPVSSFTQSLISQLGRIAVEMTNEELSSLQLSDRNTISALGAVDLWSSKQQEILFTTVLNSTKLSVSQLDSSTLVALGHIVCGAKASEMIYFNAVEFSKAVLYLGQLKLKCAEDQLRAMVGLLNNALAFGPTPFWGTNVFIEIGIIAAGLPDIDMSSLVRAQIEGITPLAISVIPPTKFSVVFSYQQISMFSHEQAEAVPSTVIDALSYMQKQALAMVLTPWENRPVDFRGRSLGLSLSHCPVCLLLGLLMLLVVPS